MSITATQIPERFVSGSTIEWVRSHGDYPSDDGWSLTYALSNGTIQKLITGSADGSGGFDVTFAAADNDLAAGNWYWQEWATKAAEKFVLSEGKVEVQPDLITAAADARTTAEIILEKIDAMINGSTDEDVANFQLGDRSLSKYPLTELIDLRRHYQGLVARQKTRVVERVVF